MADNKTTPAQKSVFSDMKISRFSDDSDLTDWDYAFIFDKDGKLKTVQLPFWLADDELLPDHVTRVLDLVSALKIIDKDVLH